MNKKYKRFILVNTFAIGTLKTKYFTQFVLKAQKQDVKLINASPDTVSGIDVPYLNTHNWIQGFYKPGKTPANIYRLFQLLIMRPLLTLEIIRSETRALGFNPSIIKNVLFGLSIALNFPHPYSKLTKDDLIIVFGAYYPFHKLLGYLAKNAGCKLVYCEYGMLPGYITIDGGGLNAESWPVVHNKLFDKLKITSNDNKKAKKYIDTIKNNRISMKKYRKKGKKIMLMQQNKIFIVGIEPFGTGLIPRFSQISKRLSPYYASNVDLVKDVVNTYTNKNCVIIYKPHPNIHYFPNYSERKQMPENVMFVDDLDIHDILDQSDLVITICSSVSHIALIRNIPCILVGKNALTNKGCCYELNNKDQLKSLIGRAIEQGVTKEQRGNFINYVSRELKHHMYSIRNDDGLFHRNFNNMYDNLMTNKFWGT